MLMERVCEIVTVDDSDIVMEKESEGDSDVVREFDSENDTLSLAVLVTVADSLLESEVLSVSLMDTLLVVVNEAEGDAVLV